MKNLRILFFSCILVVVSCISLSAQQVTKPQSRIAVVSSEKATTIWVSDFPKSTSVVIFDEQDNLLSIVSTNEYGAAYLTIPNTTQQTIYAKTLNGEINVSNKPVLKPEDNIALKNDHAATGVKA